MEVVHHKGRAVEMVGDVAVDAALAMVLRGLVGDEALHDLAVFCRDGATVPQINMLLGYMGGRPLPEGVSYEAIRADGNGIVSAHIVYSPTVTWKNGSLIVRKTSIPLTLAQGLAGEPLRRVADHPLLPDLLVARASLAGTTLTIATKARDARMRRAA